MNKDYLSAYDPITIGNRIIEQREKKGFTQKEMCEQITKKGVPVGRTKYSQFENAKELKDIPDLDIMLAMCDIFGCELGYLLGEYDLPTRAITDVNEVTGLSKDAIEILISFKNSNKDNPFFRSRETDLDFLSYLIENYSKIDKLMRDEVSLIDTIKQAKSYKNFDYAIELNNDMPKPTIKITSGELHLALSRATSDEYQEALKKYIKTQYENKSEYSREYYYLLFGIAALNYKEFNEKLWHFSISDTFLDIVKDFIKEYESEETK